MSMSFGWSRALMLSLCAAALGACANAEVAPRPDARASDGSASDGGSTVVTDGAAVDGAAAVDSAAECPAGQTRCGASCVDPQTDRLNCGACGTACAAGQSCAEGGCRLDCPAGQMACGGMCIGVQTDVMNCGSCARMCPSPDNAAPACTMGVCGAGACAGGFADCDRDTSNGCEVDTRSSAINCGACGTACPAGQSCVMGTCRVDCPLPGTRCTVGGAMQCVDTSSNLAHCGACNNACASGPNSGATCSLGSCGLRCSIFFANCDGMASTGCEVDTRTSNLNCGACGRACAAGQTCAGGTCLATATLANPFDTASNFPTGWSRVGNGGGAAMSVLSATCAMRGAQGLNPNSDVLWRNTPIVGPAGTRASVYFRALTSARAYLFFGISGTTGFALAAGTNTSTLIWQSVSNVTSTAIYSDLQSTPFTFTNGAWYRLEVAFNGTSTVTGNLYAANGTTMLWTQTRVLPSVPSGGVGLRSFGGLCMDELEGTAR